MPIVGCSSAERIANQIRLHTDSGLTVRESEFGWIWKKFRVIRREETAERRFLTDSCQESLESGRIPTVRLTAQINDRRAAIVHIPRLILAAILPVSVGWRYFRRIMQAVAFARDGFNPIFTRNPGFNRKRIF